MDVVELDLVELILAGADVWRLRDIRSRPSGDTFDACGAGSIRWPGCGQGGGSHVGLGCPTVRSTMELGDGSGRGDMMAGGGLPDGCGAAPGWQSSGGGSGRGDGQGELRLREEYGWEYKDR